MWVRIFLFAVLIHTMLGLRGVTYPKRYRPLKPPLCPFNRTRVSQEIIDDMMDRLLVIKRR